MDRLFFSTFLVNHIRVIIKIVTQELSPQSFTATKWKWNQYSQHFSNEMENYHFIVHILYINFYIKKSDVTLL